MMFRGRRGIQTNVYTAMLISRYDRFGEEDEEGNGGGGGGGGGHHSQHGKYQSWQYFHDDFGLYDDDSEVVTLSYHDFRRSVDDAYSFWFINFYRQADQLLREANSSRKGCVKTAPELNSLW